MSVRCRRNQTVFFGLLAIFVISNGCVQTTVLTRDNLSERITPGARVLLLPPDIEVYELTAAGLKEPKADWTASAKQYVEEGLRTELQTKTAKLMVYRRPENLLMENVHQQIIKLHDAVGGAILTHQFVPNMQLPTKTGQFDWSLGEGVSILREEFDADYAMFVFFRDSYSSAGRVAMATVTTILTLGHVVPRGGLQVGFASLVDLHSGNILWFDRLVDSGGDLREADDALEAVQDLLTGFPL